MISLEQIEETIIELEHNDTTFATVAKLADLYTVRNNLKGYSTCNSEPINLTTESEFLKVVNGKPPEKAWAIIDELMTAIAVLHPRMHEKVLEKMQEI